MDFDIDQLRKFYRDECSEEEVKQILSWFSDPAQKESVLSSIELNWFKFETEETDRQKTISELKEKINFKLGPSNDHKKKVFKLNTAFIWESAAVVLLAMAVSYLLWQNNQKTPDLPLQGIISENYAIKATPKGKKLHTRLSDGSTVVLNSESKISYKEHNFSDSVRSVYLEGEAYFQVAKNDTVPFIVSTRDLTITALGTSFNVKTYPEEGKAYVALEEGKISVKKIGTKDSKEEPVFLDPGEIVTFDNAKEKISLENGFDFDTYMGWKNGLLLFHEDNFSEVVKKLERWYGIDIVILNQDKSAGWNYSGRFNNASLVNVLAGISFTKSFDYELTETTLYIKFKS